MGSVVTVVPTLFEKEGVSQLSFRCLLWKCQRIFHIAIRCELECEGEVFLRSHLYVGEFEAKGYYVVFIQWYSAVCFVCNDLIPINQGVTNKFRYSFIHS